MSIRIQNRQREGEDQGPRIVADSDQLLGEPRAIRKHQIALRGQASKWSDPVWCDLHNESPMRIRVLSDLPEIAGAERIERLSFTAPTHGRL